MDSTHYKQAARTSLSACIGAIIGMVCYAMITKNKMPGKDIVKPAFWVSTSIVAALFLAQYFHHKYPTRASAMWQDTAPSDSSTDSTTDFTFNNNDTWDEGEDTQESRYDNTWSMYFRNKWHRLLNAGAPATTTAPVTTPATTPIATTAGTTTSASTTTTVAAAPVIPTTSIPTTATQPPQQQMAQYKYMF